MRSESSKRPPTWIDFVDYPSYYLTGYLNTIFVSLALLLMALVFFFAGVVAVSMQAQTLFSGGCFIIAFIILVIAIVLLACVYWEMKRIMAST